ncbi:MAG: nucleotidyltransferase family protein [Clostridia bacterium]|nr:nucleotidyltransferase family protein [Clostridia bacterium]
MDKEHITVYRQTLDVIRKSLWGTGQATADENVYSELKLHCILGLAAPVLPELSLEPALYDRWLKSIIYQVGRYYCYLEAQSTLPVTVPYVILKGTAAADYYPCPEYRTFGDIDIMVKREDYRAACDMMLEDGYLECTSEGNADRGRHREFVKKNISVEVHAFFALLNDEKAAEYLDELIEENIGPSHKLPDAVNGLVLLEHISQHLEEGLGLRQIIDWMMFVDKCLPDEKWPEFQPMAQKIGLEKLAVITTRMCEVYLGLPERKWCSDAKGYYCEELMLYILSCGNFGNKRIDDLFDYNVTTFSEATTLKKTIAMLQRRGMINWEAARKHRIIQPFAWIYQLVRYFFKGFKRHDSISQFKKEHREARRRNELFDVLGVRQKSKDLFIYKEGKYQKE